MAKPVGPSPVSMDMSVYDKKMQRLKKSDQRMTLVSSTLAIILRLYTFLIQSVDISFPR